MTNSTLNEGIWRHKNTFSKSFNLAMNKLFRQKVLYLGSRTQVIKELIHSKARWDRTKTKKTQWWSRHARLLTITKTIKVKPANQRTNRCVYKERKKYHLDLQKSNFRIKIVSTWNRNSDNFLPKWAKDFWAQLKEKYFPFSLITQTQVLVIFDWAK